MQLLLEFLVHAKPNDTMSLKYLCNCLEVVLVMRHWISFGGLAQQHIIKVLTGSKHRRKDHSIICLRLADQPQM